MILLLGGLKGGSGKTTVALNLAILQAAAGRNVLLVDGDLQQTARDFTLLRQEQLDGDAGYDCLALSEPAVRSEIERLSGEYDDIIIDTGGHETATQRAALALADALLVPFIPRAFDFWTLDRVAGLVDDVRVRNPNLRAYTFLNRADPRKTQNAGAIEVLDSAGSLTFLNTSLRSRKAFSTAAAQGLAVTELRPPDRKATREMKALHSKLFGRRPS